MVALAIPLLEGAGEAITAAWAAFISSGAATATAGGAATAAVLALPGDTAKDKAKAEAQPLARTREQRCKCPPEKGQRLPPPHRVTGLSAEYQHYVTGFPMGIEFSFAGKWFDGFYPPDCLLQEAKANYDFFFEENAAPKFFFLHGKGPDNPDTTESPTSAYKSIMREAETQSDVVVENPPAKLRWYFMQERFYKWATKEFLREALPISTELKPMV